MNETKVSVPAGAPGAGMGNVPDTSVKTGKGIKGFGSGSMNPSLEGNDMIGKSSNGKGPVKGFSGSGVKGGKV